MLIKCSVPYKGYTGGSYFYSYHNYVLDTDDFIAEPYKNETEVLLNACGLSLNSTDLSVYLSNMSCVFKSEDLCFLLFGIGELKGDYHIWHKGFYYNIKDDGNIISVNGKRYRYSIMLKGNLEVRSIDFIGLYEGVLKFAPNFDIYFKIDENSVVMQDIFNYKQVKDFEGVKMSRETFLRKCLTH